MPKHACQPLPSAIVERFEFAYRGILIVKDSSVPSGYLGHWRAVQSLIVVGKPTILFDCTRKGLLARIDSVLDGTPMPPAST